ncbi:response regulator [Flavobacterium arcticum]|uniref:Response regulator n=1 Tax=Flavobacterium arcticum TaxID=1784713 RepID=A0A345HE01_9FLAO|nr:response regulator [Flavobacterium arcticum]AXG74811.1 response regulator [Flavobacterium arcticum]KAF2509691.1 response regulator [Flavobacterium arcticum]
MKQLKCIMLVDDNKTDNFFHERVIRKANAAETVIVKESAEEALDYLKNKANNSADHPDLILLDINMPGMNGWEFIEEYEKLDEHLQSKMVVVMLTTSENPDDYALSKKHDVLADFKTKPLTVKMLEDMISKFNEKVECNT